MPEKRTFELTVCMGSSCFARGNSRNLEAVQELLKERAVPLELRGHLCEGHCEAGPNVTLDGRLHQAVDPAALTALINELLRK